MIVEEIDEFISAQKAPSTSSPFLRSERKTRTKYEWLIGDLRRHLSHGQSPSLGRLMGLGRKARWTADRYLWL